ncbi:hypothetical protein H6P81_010887 [Aristolochia fimbriata]|uniref:DUF829 domain-containing protein n=1 Tax=Aristolochia fimbriata TaxID=158543 RepID=A0AAV7EQ13_ARIFI|nr:hypothetical protein H6P81_010887 [Aristolochia fimbriata]
MWGSGARFYWGRKETKGVKGVVVVFAWLSSDEKHLRRFVDLYASSGWNSLICHSEFLNMFLPDKATSIAFGLIGELVEELKSKPLPVVFAAFSGGPKACMYKVLQIIAGKCEEQPDEVKYQSLRDCICGYIYDSSPVDFTSDLGTRFVLHPSVLKMNQPPRVVAWMANAIASGLDSLFINRFEAQRAEYWQTLYSSVNMGPFLILCSEDDELAPYQIICNFSQRLQELGGDVKLVKWTSSPHVGHFKHHPTEYKAHVTELLEKAGSIYFQRIQQLNNERMSLGGSSDQIHEVCNLSKAAANSNESFGRVAVEPSDHFFLPSSMEIQPASVQDEQKERLIHLQTNQPAISAHSVLGGMLFDVCIPKNVEDWDIKGGSFSRRQRYGSSSGRNNPFNPMKCMRRSRL